MKATLAVCIVAGALAPQDVWAQCVLFPAPQLVADARQKASLIFSGVMVDQTSLGRGTSLGLGQRLSFDVDGVWKGDLTNRAVFFRIDYSEARRFVVGQRYVVFAYPETEQVRVFFKEVDANPTEVLYLGSFWRHGHVRRSRTAWLCAGVRT